MCVQSIFSSMRSSCMDPFTETDWGEWPWTHRSCWRSCWGTRRSSHVEEICLCGRSTGTWEASAMAPSQSNTLTLIFNVDNVVLQSNTLINTTGLFAEKERSGTRWGHCWTSACCTRKSRRSTAQWSVKWSGTSRTGSDICVSAVPPETWCQTSPMNSTASHSKVCKKSRALVWENSGLIHP